MKNVSCETIPDVLSIRDRKVIRILCVMYNKPNPKKYFSQFNAIMYNKPYYCHMDVMIELVLNDFGMWECNDGAHKAREIINTICRLV